MEEADGGDGLPARHLRLDDGADDSDDSDGDKYRLACGPSKPRKLTQRRKEDNAAFESWVRDNQRELARVGPRRADGEGDGGDMVLRNKSHKVIHSPREYQQELFERAKSKNTIVVLPTGSGKTLIAALLLRHTAEMELEDRAKGKPKKISVFVVDKVALVNQQAEFLRSNLDYPVGRFSGGSLDRCWNMETWERIYQDHTIIVCTAAIVHKALSHHYLAMNHINLLVFDEAHHTYKNHPYARIIKDFYAYEEPEDQPRILGLTASPTSAVEEIETAAIRLETLLDSEIATVSAEALEQASLDKTFYEEILYFEPHQLGAESKLCEAVRIRGEERPVFKRLCRDAESAALELGWWFGDRVLHLCFTESELQRITAKEEALEWEKTQAHGHRLGRKLNPGALGEGMRKLLRFYPLPGLDLEKNHLSPKLRLLKAVLQDKFKEETDARCIVFVDKRFTAVLLDDFFRQDIVRIHHMRTAFMIGCNGEFGPVKANLRDIQTTLADFRSGKINCLFATSVAEEGIDIPECDLVIRFNPCQSMIQYIQSRGRARQQRSTFYSFAELGSAKELRNINDMMYQASLLGEFCTKIPDDRRVDWEGLPIVIYDPFLNDRNMKRLRISQTGATLTMRQATEVVAAFAASLPRGDGPARPPEYYVIPTIDNKYVAHLQLHPSSPVRHKVGEPQVSKVLAKASAALEMCVELKKGNYIDGNFKPKFHKHLLPSMRNARLAVSNNKRAEYRIRWKPGLWAEVGRPEKLHGTVLTLDTPDALGRPSCPLVLLTRKPLPAIREFPLFFGSGRVSLARLKAERWDSLEVSDEELAGLATYTLRVLQDVFTKTFKAEPSEFPYFLVSATVTHGTDMSSIASLRDMIHWEDVDIVAKNETLRWDGNTSDDFLVDRFVMDPFSGGRKLITRKVRRDLTLHDLVPSGVLDPPHREYKDLEKTILNYSWGIRRKNRTHETSFREDQPVLEAEVLSLRRDFLDDGVEFESGEQTCFVVLEPLEISALRADAASMALVFPSIIHRVESTMLALEGAAIFDINVPPHLALEALTKDSDNTDEHGTEQLDFQGGMGSNYERLEFLGDTFLKMATTISIFTGSSERNEFESHVARMLLLCNKNLFNSAADRNLPEYVRSKAMTRDSWYPPNLRLTKGKRVKKMDNDTHSLGDKTIADVCEALIGAAYVHRMEEQNLDAAVRAVTAVVRSKDHRQTSYADYYAGFRMPKWQAGPFTEAHKELARQIEERMGYRFRSPALLRSAFKHPSYPYDIVPNYQRLEFLGDALLDMVCVDFLYTRNPGADPSWLTEHKMPMVSNQFLGCLGVKLGFHRHILSMNASLQGQIAEYAGQISRAEAQATEEHQGSGSASEMSPGCIPNYWIGEQDPPKAISDVVEAYLGAVFVDSEYDYSHIRRFFAQHIQPFFEDMALHDAFAGKHPVVALSRLLRSFGCDRWSLKILALPALGEDVGAEFVEDTETKVVCGLMIHRKVRFQAILRSGRYAKVAATKKALRELESMTREEYREAMGCDCSGEEEDEVYHGTAV